jgi:crossover junction endodeoxyribonuclease RuvC
MNIIGLDLSLARTGVATASGTGVLRVAASGMHRLAALRNEILDICGTSDASLTDRADLVVIEGYSMGTARQQSHAHALGELGGVVRLALFEEGIPFVDVAPAALKKYATGKGNANKGQVLEAASKRSGLDFAGDDNRADAWWLRQMGLAWMWGEPPAQTQTAFMEGYIRMPTTHQVALVAVKWPERPAAVAS